MTLSNCAPVCTSLFSVCASFDAAEQRLAKRVLMECESKFYEIVAVKEIYRELCQKHVIAQTVVNKITDSHTVEEARGHLFDHMREYGTLDSLKVFCDVITSEKYIGYPAMQDFGTEMTRRLEQEGVCVCIYVCVCVSVRVRVHVHVVGCGGVLPEVPLGPMTLE